MKVLPLTDNRPYLYGGCDVCPLSPPKIVRGFGVGDGIVIIGESPGRQEVVKGQPFVGPSGQLIRSVLRAYGQDPEDVYWTNSILCHAPPPPSKDATIACNGRLWHELALVNPTKILLLGANALKAITDPKKPALITRERGRGFTVKVGGKDVYCVATYHPAAILRDPDLYRDLANDVFKFLTHNTVDTYRPEVYVSTSPKMAVRELRTLLNEASTVSCDIETTGFSVLRNPMLSLGFGAMYNDTEGAAFILPKPIASHPDVMPLWIELLNTKRVVFWNGKFDLKWLSKDAQTKLRPPQFVDGMLRHYMLDERSGESGRVGMPGKPSKRGIHSLKDVARYYFDAEDYHFDFAEFFAIEEKTLADWNELFFYQGLDCYYTARLDIYLNRELEAEQNPNLPKLDKLLHRASLTLSEIETRGVRADVPYLIKWVDSLEEGTADLREELENLVRIATGIEDFNPQSALEVKRLIYDEWNLPKQIDPYKKSTQYPVTKEVLQTLSGKLTDPVQQKIIESLLAFRASAKLLSTYAHGLLRAAQHDGRIHPNFSLHGTVTGRTSCSNPNLQNIPTKIGDVVHNVFIADEGNVYVKADYAQIELRVAAYYSEDPGLIQVFKDGRDIHSETAMRIFKKPADQISKLERRLTKELVFGIIYGRGPESIANGREMQLVVDNGGKRWSRDDASKFQRLFLSGYPGLREWITQRHADAITQQYVETPIGRRRRFPLVMPGKFRADAMRQAANAPIQSLASDILLTAMCALHHSLPEGSHILLPIHDELQFEIPKEDFVTVSSHIKWAMEGVPSYLLGTDIPFPVEMSVGSGWGDVAGA